MGRPISPPPQHQGHPIINNLADCELDQLRPDQKREGSDWFAIFNPRIPRSLDVDLVHTLVHESVVCCVRFSHDGRYVATGCNRSAQIFEVATGSQVTKLQDESVDKEGDLYIRSVCFSPDGKYLATGAEDKQIRVRKDIQNPYHRLIIEYCRFGISQIVLSGIPFPDTSKIFTRWTLRETVGILHLVAETVRFGFGILIADARS